jgi:hypothetical protein
MQKLTRWFPADVNPTRIGVYFKDGYSKDDGYQYWDGKVWWYGGSIKDAANQSSGRCIVPHPWRGLASDPNARNMEVDRHEDDTDNWW